MIGIEVANIDTPDKIFRGKRTSISVNFTLKKLNPKYLQYKILVVLNVVRDPTTLTAKAVNL